MDESIELNEPREPKRAISPNDWEEFLREFSERNYNRRARIEVFRRDGTVEDEGQESHLEDVSLKSKGAAKNVEIIRIDRTESNAEKRKETVTNVRGIAVQFDTDGSEDALEITDDRNSLIHLRFESKVDGAS